MTDAPRLAGDRFVDLSARAKFRVIGADRFRFINGQITNDLRKASEASAIEACVLNAKGRTEGHVFVSEVAESYLIDAEAAVREKLRARLERYVIADDVEIEDVTDSFSVFHVLSSEAPPTELGRIVSAQRFAARGWDIWSDASKHNDVWQQLSSRYVFLDPAAAEVLRIEDGIPQWGSELTEQIIPVEANLEMRTIDYQKGCYIGQEVISRMKMSSQTNKRLSGLIRLDDGALHPQMKLIATSNDAKEVGWITSATRSDRMQREIALGYVKRGFNTIGTKLNAVDADSKTETVQPVEVVSLPFH
jgi:tRNA-modifying protein YgfZ